MEELKSAGNARFIAQCIGRKQSGPGGPGGNYKEGRGEWHSRSWAGGGKERREDRKGSPGPAGRGLESRARRGREGTRGSEAPR